MKQPPRTSKYGKDSPCDGCIHIGLSSGDLPCRECMMVLKPSNYVNKEAQKLEAKIAEYNRWLNEVQRSEYEGLRRSRFLEKFTEIFQTKNRKETGEKK